MKGETYTIYPSLPSLSVNYSSSFSSSLSTTLVVSSSQDLAKLPCYNSDERSTLGVSETDIEDNTWDRKAKSFSLNIA